MTEAFTTRTTWNDFTNSVIIHLVNTHGVDVYTLQLGEDTVKAMMNKEQQCCDSTITVAEVEDDERRKAVYVNSYGSKGQQQIIRCETRGKHIQHSGAMRLAPIGDRRPDASQSTVIRIFW